MGSGNESENFGEAGKVKKCKVVKIDSDIIEFDNGIRLYSKHNQDCCESHYLFLDDLTMADFEGLLFDLSTDSFFERIEDFGIALKPSNGHPVRIPGHGYNNGYYSSNLTLVLSKEGVVIKTFDITKCQVIKD